MKPISVYCLLLTALCSLLTTHCSPAVVQSVPPVTPEPTATPTLTLTPTPEPTYTPYPTRPAATLALSALYIDPSFAPEVQKILARLKACSPHMYDFVNDYVYSIVPIPPELERPQELGLADPEHLGLIALSAQRIELSKTNDAAEYQMMITVVHEARHAWQYRTGHTGSYAEDEQDADRFTLPLLDVCPASDQRIVNSERLLIEIRIKNPPSGPPP